MLELGGIALLPEWPVFASFAVAGLALNLVPGADMAFVVASAARGGRRDGIVAALGIGLGTLVHILAAVIGLSALLASSQAAFNAVKWIGAAYLLWIAISMVRNGRGSTEPVKPPQRQGLLRAAALVNILNPKVALFFLAFLPQFVDPGAAVPAVQILCLGLWFNAIGTLVNVAVALAAAGAAERLRGVTWLGIAARWIGATVLGAMAIKLALSERDRAVA